MDETTFENFVLDVFDYKFNGDNGAETFKVRVLDSPAGQRGFQEAIEVTLPVDVRDSLYGLDKRMLPRKELIALGTKLADVLFPSHCREMLERSRPDALKGFDVLRIQLRLNALELSNIPWEYAYIARPGTPTGQEDMNGFLVLDRSLSLVRFEQLRQPAGKVMQNDGQPLRMVMVTANPDKPPYEKLTEIDKEVANIGQIVNEINTKHNGIIRYELFQDATVDKLVDAFAAPADIFHFAGHGRFKRSPGSPLDDTGGAIVLMNDGNDGGNDVVEFGSDKLAGLLRRGGDSGVKLAMLGACEVGRRDGINAWTGVVPALIRAGIPAVVGMQFKIGDSNAKDFSRAFYRALAEGQTIDDAVALGRQAIFLKSSDPNERDWGVPVLYLRTTEATLFPKVQDAKDTAKTKDVSPPPSRVWTVENVSVFMLQYLRVEDIRPIIRYKFVDVKKVVDVSKASLQDMVDPLIDYCDSQGRMDELLAAIKEKNPKRFAEFEAGL